MQQYETYMKKCIELAKLAEGCTSPNPMVGCIVLDKNGKEISSGYHAKYGEYHAERNALLKVKGNEAEGGTLFVNLEPCSHFGKTPPCTDIIIEKGIKKVVIGTSDANPKVNGIQKLKDAGIEVIENILEDECRQLNEVFLINQAHKRTFIAIKTAATLDGKIATQSGSSKWITGSSARAEVKNIRARYDAIMTSSVTVLTDNPTMEHKKKVLLDRGLKTDVNAPFYKSGEIYVFFDKNLTPPDNTDRIKYLPVNVINGKLELKEILDKLYEIGIMSVLVEAGMQLNGMMLPYADKIYHFIAPKITADNSAKSCFDFRHIIDINESANFRFDSIKIYEPDILLVYYPSAVTQ